MSITDDTLFLAIHAIGIGALIAVIAATLWSAL